MNFLDVILVGVALAMDACALSVANCVTFNHSLTRKKEWAMPVAYALFQGIMPLIGYFLGSFFAKYLLGVADYLTAGIFFVLGVKIIIDLLSEGKNEHSQPAKSKFTYGLLALQALATSIDALFVGITFINVAFSVYLAVIIIAVVTFALTALAILLGKKLGKVFGKYAEWVGAAILIILSIKSLLEGLLG